MITIGTCAGCSKVGLRPAGSSICPDCAAPVRTRSRICGAHGCSDPIQQQFNIDVVLEPSPMHNPHEVEITAEAINKIVRGIILIEGGLCERHLSARFESICHRNNGSPSGFDLIYKDLEKANAREKNEKFREEWA